MEMAANLHVKQTHNGTALVQGGPGPGPQASTEKPGGVYTGIFMSSADSSSSAAGPAKPVASSGAAVSTKFVREIRRARPTPQPLYASSQSVAEDDMKELMDMWDDIGSSRLGDFTAAKEVKKVYAAPPPGSENIPTYASVLNPETPNPFAALLDKQAPKTEETATKPVESLEKSVGKAVVDMKATRTAAAADDDDWLFEQTTADASTATPFSPETIPSPFTVPLRDVLTAKTGQQQQQQVPKTQQLPSSSSIPTATATTIPSETESAKSPFADSPFADSPFAAAAPSGDGSSSLAQVASPFGTSSSSSSNVEVQSLAMWLDPHMSASPTTTIEGTSKPQKRFKCDKCGKDFGSHRGLVAHANAKHQLDIKSLKEGIVEKESPDIPPYVPTALDFATVPYGRAEAKCEEWRNVELYPLALAATNIELVGSIAELSKDKASLQLRVQSTEADGTHEEVIPVVCHGPAAELVSNLTTDQTVLVTGVLRLNPRHDKVNNRYTASPRVVVATPLGTIAPLN